MIRWCKTHDNTGYDGANVCDRYWHPAFNVGGENTCEFVDAVVLSRQPCNNCDGKGFDTVQSTRGPYETDDLPCPSCSGSGTTWPDELIEAMVAVYSQDEHVRYNKFVRGEMAKMLDALALVVQEGTDT